MAWIIVPIDAQYMVWFALHIFVKALLSKKDR